MDDQVSIWRRVCADLGVEVVAPCELALSNGAIFRATALVKLGPQSLMVVDPDWSAHQPHADALVADGYGYSAVTLEDAPASTDLIKMFRDLGWSRRAARRAALRVSN